MRTRFGLYRTLTGAVVLVALVLLAASLARAQGPLPEIGLDAHCNSACCGPAGVDLDLDPEAGLQFLQVAVRPAAGATISTVEPGPDLVAADWTVVVNVLGDGTWLWQGQRPAGPLYQDVRHVLTVLTNQPANGGWSIWDACVQGVAATTLSGTWSAAGGGGNWSSYCGEHVIGTAGCGAAGAPLAADAATWGSVKALWR